jgi:hypothetical protein
MTFALHRKEKKQLDSTAHEISIKEGKKITNGELIRRALQQVYRIGVDCKRTKVGELAMNGRKRREKDKTS